MTWEFCTSCGCEPCDCNYGNDEVNDKGKTDERIQTGQQSDNSSTDAVRQTRSEDASREWSNDQYSCQAGHGCGRFYSIHYKDR